jgi:hypothetical protein
MKFESNWWTAMLPDGYTAEANDDCVDIIGPQEIGVIQISSYRKNDEKVTLDELLEFASDEVGRDELDDITLSEFCGYTYEHADNETYWRRWWLAFDRTMIYATYQCNSNALNEERSHVDSVISSFRIKS